MSPILFSLFINDIEQSLQTNLLDGISLDQITIFLLLFADDAVIMSDTKQGLQNSLNKLEAYCEKWKQNKSNNFLKRWFSRTRNVCL